MAVTRWNPFREVMGMQRSLSRLMDDAFEGRSDNFGSWAFPVDIYETDEAIEVRAEIPGVDMDDINLELSNRQLTIKADRPERTAREERVNWLRKETGHGSFSRTFTLSVPIDADGIRADYQDGILNVHLPKSESVKPKRIPINGA